MPRDVAPWCLLEAARAENSLAVPGRSWSVTTMAYRGPTQPPDDTRPPTETALDPASVEAVARRVVELIRSEGGPSAGRRLVDAATLAAELGVERSWIYAHRAELGAIQLGSGSKPRLRFDLGTAWDALAHAAGKGSRKPTTPADRRVRRRRLRTTDVSVLLPIRGSASTLDADRERS